MFSVDTDAHAPGQLDWQPYGCERAEACGVPAERIVNTRGVDDLLAWAAPARLRDRPGAAGTGRNRPERELFDRATI